MLINSNQLSDQINTSNLQKIMFLFLFFTRIFCEAPDKETVEYIDEGLRGRVEHMFSDDQLKSFQSQSETHAYQAEITRLMNILVDSLYQNKDIFMRELISNANDALDKIRFSAIRDSSVLDNGPKDLEILIDIDENNRTLSITDTGIGMTKNDLIEKLGTIAKSGTNDFQKLLQSGDTNLIGQFGVGFYSAFLVADKVTVISKNNKDADQWIWVGDVSNQYTVVKDPRGNTLGRGTQIILHLKENSYNYLDRDRLISIIRHYSMFVDFPIKIWHYHQVFAEQDEDIEEFEEMDHENVFDGDDVVESSDESSSEYVTFNDGQNQKKGIKKNVWQWEQVNTRKPLWLTDPDDIPENDYQEFFKAFFKDGTAPLYHIHFKAEGRITFNALLFIPATAPPADKIMERITRNVRLYVRRVLVQDEWADELLPDYLHFVKGVIDSADLTLNVDRDHLSKANTLRLIKRRVTTKLISVFSHLYQFEPGVYFQFYKNFAGNLKYGVIEDSQNKRALSKLLMFFTSYSPNDLTRLDDYVSRMKKGQDKIYYIGSSTRESAAVSPYLEDLYSRGIEVIFAIEPIDLYCLDRLEEFEGFPLENPEKEKDKGRAKSSDLNTLNVTQREYTTIQRWFKKTIGERLDKIQLSSRLKSTPAIASAPNWGYTASHERLIRAQTVYDQRLTDSILLNKKILELNPEHPTVKEMFKRIKENPDDEDLKSEAILLFDTALLAGGFSVDGVLNYTKRVFRMLGKSHNLLDTVDEFEEKNAVYYTTIDDEFKSWKKQGKKKPQKENAADKEAQNGNEKEATNTNPKSQGKENEPVKADSTKSSEL
ncbi:Hsp90 protein [Tritrichomonas foetus]|uniref:Hsp90 protein n=1 Tax=Tritrichomonas foetus TaxID=1144522 RepID=A0A1J4J8M6_9EUKA|nr:Hsp90 protein [Tritrichomonas foetus]|eukprot:OHS95534.1 Hsp90 protein [Tritrichomonas foetus]